MEQITLILPASTVEMLHTLARRRSHRPGDLVRRLIMQAYLDDLEEAQTGEPPAGARSAASG